MTRAQASAADRALLAEMVTLARRSGDRLRERFTTQARIVDRASIEATFGIEEVSAKLLGEALRGLRPDARWLEDDADAHHTADERSGEWWVVDGVEGAVNFIHGVAEFSVNLTLLRDNQPALTVVYEPVADRLYQALRGGGAQLNGRPLAVSTKTDLALAIATTSEAGGTDQLYRLTADAIRVMFTAALLVRQTVPSTFPLLNVAAGHYDVFWRFGPDLPGLAAGVLLAREAGATVSDLSGQEWKADSPDVLVAAPGLYDAALALLRAGGGVPPRRDADHASWARSRER